VLIKVPPEERKNELGEKEVHLNWGGKKTFFTPTSLDVAKSTKEEKISSKKKQQPEE